MPSDVAANASAKCDVDSLLGAVRTIAAKLSGQLTGKIYEETRREEDKQAAEREEREHLRGLADELGLIMTGSSDYHGTNKTTPIGACTTEPDQFEALLAAGTGSAPFRD